MRPREFLVTHYRTYQIIFIRLWVFLDVVKQVSIISPWEHLRKLNLPMFTHVRQFAHHMEVCFNVRNYPYTTMGTFRVMVWKTYIP